MHIKLHNYLQNSLVKQNKYNKMSKVIIHKGKLELLNNITAQKKFYNLYNKMCLLYKDTINRNNITIIDTKTISM